MDLKKTRSDIHWVAQAAQFTPKKVEVGVALVVPGPFSCGTDALISQSGSVSCVTELSAESSGFLSNLAVTGRRHSLDQRTADDGAVRPPAAHLAHLISSRDTATHGHWNC